MKLVFISTILILVTSLDLHFLQVGIGQSCYAFSSISQAQMTSNPWPITAGVNVNTFLNGTLSKDEIIGDVIVTQTLGTSSTMQNVTINKAYAKSSLFEFSYQFTAPIKSGTYSEKYQVLQNVTQNQLLCWQFSFII